MVTPVHRSETQPRAQSPGLCRGHQRGRLTPHGTSKGPGVAVAPARERPPRPPHGVTSTWGSLALVGASEGECGRGHKPRQRLEGRGPAWELGLPRWLSGKGPTRQRRSWRRPGFNPWVGKTPWRRKWQSTPVFLPGKSHRQRSLVGYSPWGHKRVGHSLHTKQQQHP